MPVECRKRTFGLCINTTFAAETRLFPLFGNQLRQHDSSG